MKKLFTLLILLFAVLSTLMAATPTQTATVYASIPCFLEDKIELRVYDSEQVYKKSVKLTEVPNMYMNGDKVYKAEIPFTDTIWIDDNNGMWEWFSVSTTSTKYLSYENRRVADSFDEARYDYEIGTNNLVEFTRYKIYLREMSLDISVRHIGNNVYQGESPVGVRVDDNQYTMTYAYPSNWTDTSNCVRVEKVVDAPEQFGYYDVIGTYDANTQSFDVTWNFKNALVDLYFKHYSYSIYDMQMDGVNKHRFELPSISLNKGIYYYYIRDGVNRIKTEEIEISIAEDGIYDLVWTYNASTQEYNVDITKINNSEEEGGDEGGDDNGNDNTGGDNTGGEEGGEVTPPTPTPTPNDITLYYVNSSEWDTVNGYVWPTGGTGILEWPGSPATKIDKTVDGFDVYSYTFDSTKADNIIFNAGLGGAQTKDLAVNASKPYYYGGVWYETLTFDGEQGDDSGDQGGEEGGDQGGEEGGDQGGDQGGEEGGGDTPVVPDPTPEPEELAFFVAGNGGSDATGIWCNGIEWSSVGVETANNMTDADKDGIYEITFNQVPAGTWNFKVVGATEGWMGSDFLDTTNSSTGYTTAPYDGNIGFTLTQAANVTIKYNTATGKIILTTPSGSFGKVKIDYFAVANTDECYVENIFEANNNTLKYTVDIQVSEESGFGYAVFRILGNCNYAVYENSLLVEVTESGKYEVTIVFNGDYETPEFTITYVKQGSTTEPDTPVGPNIPVGPDTPVKPEPDPVEPEKPDPYPSYPVRGYMYVVNTPDEHLERMVKYKPISVDTIDYFLAPEKIETKIYGYDIYKFEVRDKEMIDLWEYPNAQYTDWHIDVNVDLSATPYLANGVWYSSIEEMMTWYVRYIPNWDDEALEVMIEESPGVYVATFDAFAESDDNDKYYYYLGNVEDPILEVGVTENGTILNYLQIPQGFKAMIYLDDTNWETEWKTYYKLVPPGKDWNRDCIDLGLSSGLCWATKNLGATEPQQEGTHFAWGEVEPKEDYSYNTYKWANLLKNNKYIKYVTDDYWGTIVDFRTTLEPTDDAANVALEGKWYMPTQADVEELLRECTTEFGSYYGVNGYFVTGPNGNAIFLPAVGIKEGTDYEESTRSGDYWTSSLYEDNQKYAVTLSFSLAYIEIDDMQRTNGLAIRPVIHRDYVGIEEVVAINVYAKDHTIYCEEPFQIYTVTGIEVTHLNGVLEGVYIVKTAEGNRLISVW